MEAWQVTAAEARNGEGTLPLAISKNPIKLLVVRMDPVAGRNRMVPVTGLVLRGAQYRTVKKFQILHVDAAFTSSLVWPAGVLRPAAWGVAARRVRGGSRGQIAFPCGPQRLRRPRAIIGL
jgi:hypothetical protein